MMGKIRRTDWLPVGGDPLGGEHEDKDQFTRAHAVCASTDPGNPGLLRMPPEITDTRFEKKRHFAK